MNEETNAGAEMVPQGTDRIDLAVYAHRVLAVLRPLGPIECEVVLRAALELNRASSIRPSPAVSADESI